LFRKSLPKSLFTVPLNINLLNSLGILLYFVFGFSSILEKIFNVASLRKLSFVISNLPYTNSAFLLLVIYFEKYSKYSSAGKVILEYWSEELCTISNSASKIIANNP